jgi:hypothetical protein
MGLAISVGIEREFLGYDEEAIAYYRSQFRALSAELAKHDILWSEPALDATPGVPPNRSPDGFGYSTIHYLRRASALQRRGDEVTPVPPGEQPDSEPASEETYDLSSHLICHADDSGYYIPVNFADPLFLELGDVCSSNRLLSELTACASAIGILLDKDGTLSDAEAARVAAYEGPYSNEWMAWLALYEAARISIATGHALVFH